MRPSPRSCFGFLLALCVSAAAGAHAADGGWTLEFGPYFGYYDFDSATAFEDFGLFGARLGAHLGRRWGVEASFDEVYTERERTGSAARQISFALAARYEPWPGRWSPFALAGLALVMLDDSDSADAVSDAIDLGLGLRYSWGAGWSLRAETVLRRQEFERFRWVVVEDDAGEETVLESLGPDTLWGRSFRLGVQRAF